MEIVIRAAIAFALLWLLTKASGRATLGELSSFDLLVFVTMGDLIQQGITAEDRTLTGGVLAVATFALLAVALDFASSHSTRISRIVEGPPVVLVSQGTIHKSALRRFHISDDELRTAARQSGFESLDGIRLAVLEHNGKISFFEEQGHSEKKPRASL